MVPSMRQRKLVVRWRRPAAVHAALPSTTYRATTRAGGTGPRHPASAGTPTDRASAAGRNAHAGRPPSTRLPMARPAHAGGAAHGLVPATLRRSSTRPPAEVRTTAASRRRAPTRHPGFQAWRVRHTAPATAAIPAGSRMRQGDNARMRWMRASSGASGAISWPRNQRQSLSSSQSSSRRKTARSASGERSHSRSSQRTSNWSSSRIPRRQRQRRRLSCVASSSLTRAADPRRSPPTASTTASRRRRMHGTDA